MNNRIDAIYARQSVDKRIAFLLKARLNLEYELKGGNCKEYARQRVQRQEHRPPEVSRTGAGHQDKRGLIAKVIVYKLDRISRSILELANMMELFQQYNVELFAA